MPRSGRFTVVPLVLAAVAIVVGTTLIAVAATRDDPGGHGSSSAATLEGGRARGGAGAGGDPSGPVWGFLRSDTLSLAAPSQPPDTAAAGSWQVVDALAAARPVITRPDVGRYRVVFPGIGVSGGRGAAIATTVGGGGTSGVAHCHVVGWDAVAAGETEAASLPASGRDTSERSDSAAAPSESGGVADSGGVDSGDATEPALRVDERVDLACRGTSGEFTDARFTVLFTYVPAGHLPSAGGEPFAYLRHDDASRARSRPDNAYSVTGPGTLEVRRLSEGHYTVDLVGPEYVRPGNNLQVNAVGETPAGCNALGREVRGDRQSVFVGCADGREWTDTPFVLLYVDQHALLPTDARGYGHVFTGVSVDGGPVEPAPLGGAVDAWRRYSANSSAAVNTVRRTGVGAYEVVFPGIGGTPDHVEVTPYGEPTARCAVDDWVSDSRPEYPGAATVRLHCVDAAGRPVDSHASVAYVSVADPTR